LDLDLGTDGDVVGQRPAADEAHPGRGIVVVDVKEIVLVAIVDIQEAAVDLAGYGELHPLLAGDHVSRVHTDLVGLLQLHLFGFQFLKPLGHCPDLCLELVQRLCRSRGRPGPQKKRHRHQQRQGFLFLHHKSTSNTCSSDDLIRKCA
jgi:hypothetical protein